MPQPSAERTTTVSPMISEARDAFREEIAELSSVWHRHIERLFEERFAGLAERIEHELESDLGKLRHRVRRETVEEFHRAARRLRGYESEGQWGSAVLDSIAGFCSRSVLVTLRDRALRVLSVSGPAEGAPEAGFELPLTSAPAVAAVLESRDSLVAAVAASGISQRISAWFEGSGAASCAIVPVLVRERVEAVLLAAGGGLEVDGIEAMAALAGTALETRGRAPVTPVPDEAGITMPLAGEVAAEHLRAQRFARVRAAEIRLYNAQAVRAGRTRKRLYAELKEEIDSARAAYDREFLQASVAMPDYLHRELVRTLANEELAALGEEYPGPLA
jgi:hypothetical protein